MIWILLFVHIAACAIHSHDYSRALSLLTTFPRSTTITTNLTTLLKHGSFSRLELNRLFIRLALAPDRFPSIVPIFFISRAENISDYVIGMTRNESYYHEEGRKLMAFYPKLPANIETTAMIDYVDPHSGEKLFEKMVKGRVWRMVKVLVRSGCDIRGRYEDVGKKVREEIENDEKKSDMNENERKRAITTSSCESCFTKKPKMMMPLFKEPESRGRKI